MTRLALLLVLTAPTVADGPEDLEVLLRSKETKDRIRAARKLGRRPGIGAAALRVSLADSVEAVRHESAVALATRREHGERVVAVLRKSLESKDWYVRWQACLALKALGGQAQSAVPQLLHALCDTERDVCREATLALGSIAPGDKRVVLALAKLLDANHPVDYTAVWHVLSAGGHKTGPAYPWLARAAADRRHHGERAREWLVRAEGPGAAQAIIDLFDLHPATRVRGARRLVRLGSPRVIPLLVWAAKDDSARVRTWALTALGQKRARGALPTIIRAVLDPDDGTRSAARYALRAIEPELRSVIGYKTKDHVEARLILEAYKPYPALWRLITDKRLGPPVLKALSEVVGMSEAKIVEEVKASLREKR